MRRQLAAPLGGKPQLPRGGQVAGPRGEVEEDFRDVRGVWREPSVAGDGGWKYLRSGFELVYDHAGHHLSGRCYAEVSEIIFLLCIILC